MSEEKRDSTPASGEGEPELQVGPDAWLDEIRESLAGGELLPRADQIVLWRLAAWRGRYQPTQGEEIVDEDVVDDLRLALARVTDAVVDRHGRAPKEQGEALLKELRRAGYLGDPVVMRDKSGRSMSRP